MKALFILFFIIALTPWAYIFQRHGWTVQLRLFFLQFGALAILLFIVFGDRV